MSEQRARPIRPWGLMRHLFLIAGALIAFFPFYWMFVLSTHRSSAIHEFPPPLIPGDRFWENFQKVTGTVNVWAAMMNTLIVASVVTFVVLFLDSVAAFAFSKFSFRGRGILFGIIMFTFLLPGQLSTIPLFLVMSQVGWVGKLQAVMFPAFANAFGIFWLRQYFTSVVHVELIEAATMDGCGFFRQYFHVALPAARPALAFLGIFTFIGSWNDFLWPLIVLNNPNQLTLQVVLSQLQTAHGTDYGMVMMGAFIAVAPLLLIFVVGSRQFLSGLTEGAVKM